MQAELEAREVHKLEECSLHTPMGVFMVHGLSVELFVDGLYLAMSFKPCNFSTSC